MGPEHDVATLADAVFDLVVARGPQCGNHAIVAVDGRSGAGKTTLATELAAQLGADLLSLEAMYQGWHGLDATIWAVRDRLLVPLARGEAAAYPTWDWAAGAPGPDRPVRPGTLLVLEGVGAFAVTALLSSARVWVEADAATRKERAIARDGDTYAPWWDTWAEQEERHLAEHGGPEHADLTWVSAP